MCVEPNKRLLFFVVSEHFSPLIITEGFTSRVNSGFIFTVTFL